tara:strand:- start:2259 stop:2495 length:237 start_codon:yes stop_codon:yes gene_type:complete
MYTIILVHTAMCGVNVSPCNMIGIRFTCTVALYGVTGNIGVSGCGGHQQVYSLIVIEYGIGVLPQDCTECTVDGRHNP